jgi:hypothetical protein
MLSAAPGICQYADEKMTSRREDQFYRAAAEARDKREWDRSIEYYDRIIRGGGARSDGALYWKAYAQFKLGRREDAIATLSQLQKSHPSSAWINDAKALEVEVRQASGQPVSPESETDEDLKLYALNSLVHSEPERTIPLLERILNSGSASPKLKQRALFVLAQSRTPRSAEILSSYAKGATNPDMQLKAIEYLGIHGAKEYRNTLSEVYASTKDQRVKRQILNSFAMSKEKDPLVAAARSESSVELRREAAQLLGVVGAKAELAQLYQTESSPEVKEAILDGLFHAKDVDKLIELARAERDPKLRREAVQRLSLIRSPQSSEALSSMYPSETDQSVRKQILEGFFQQRNARGLIEVARKESDIQLKKDAVRFLSMMKDKEATDYLMELLK